jgi:hypothetical protein
VTIPKTHPFWLRQWKTLTSAKSWGFRGAHCTVENLYVSSEFFWLCDQVQIQNFVFEKVF